MTERDGYFVGEVTVAADSIGAFCTIRKGVPHEPWPQPRDGLPGCPQAE